MSISKGGSQKQEAGSSAEGSQQVDLSSRRHCSSAACGSTIQNRQAARQQAQFNSSAVSSAIVK